MTEKTVTLNKKVPAFHLPATGDKKLRLSDFKGKNLVIYFYPKDNTPGCTTEGQDFTTLYKEFKKKNTEIIGVSRDSIRKHENFKEKYAFPFDLISDEEEVLCKLFDVIKMKSMYGKKYLGIERSTFLINDKGVLVKEWRKVRVKEHAQAVLDAIDEL